MAEYIEREAALALVKPDVPEDEKAVVTIATAKKLVRSIVQRAPTADVAPVVHWVSVNEKLPKLETEVLIVCDRGGYKFVAPAIYEDGTMLTQESSWNWYEIESYGLYDETTDDYFVPEGWWENRQFCPDDVYNNPVDCAVTHWMPLPEPPKMNGGAGNAADRREKT